ncbi:hypothetical protein ACI3EY_16705 [Ornithinimicrobium sp. LYQ92]|uniref:hypothetical protein n=1 Tax=Serinicoccus sp. LYQ92 TaxID=3378798 RepID=UPI003854380E
MSWDHEAREVLVQSLDPYNVDHTRTHGERLDDVLDSLAPVVAREVARAKAEAWDEGYRAGVNDERTSSELGRIASPNRANPYDTDTEAGGS